MDRTRGTLLWFLLFLLTACGGGSDLSAPPPIAYGVDVCDRCRMLIDDPRLAAAYWTIDGDARRFDDIGGMLDYQRDTGEAVGSYWVHDYVTGAWLPAADATFLAGGGIHTPMGFGIIAVADEADAAKLQATYPAALAYDWDALRERVAAESGARQTTIEHQHEGG